jgi:DNA modification methylase
MDLPINKIICGDALTELKIIGIELNPSYCDIAKRRLQPYLEQTKL